MAKSNWYKDNKDLHFELMRFSRKYGLKGKPMSEVEKIKLDVETGRIQLLPVKMTKGTQSESKRGRDSYLGIRYLVKEVVLNMPHVMQTAYAKSTDNFWVEYMYCQTDLSKKEMAHICGFPVTTLNSKIDKGKWKKRFPLIRVGSVGMLINLIYQDPGEAIVVPPLEEIKDVDERYRQEFYKLYVRIKQASNQTVPDKDYINGLKNSVGAFSQVYNMEREVNRIMSEKDRRDIEIKQGKLDLEKSKMDGGFGEITTIEMPDNYEKNTHAMLFFLKEVMGEKGIPQDKKDEIMETLVKRMLKVTGDGEDEE